MNKIELLGCLTKDLEIRYTQNNTPVAIFSLAVSRAKHTRKNGRTNI